MNQSNQLGGHTRVQTSTTHSKTDLLIFHSISLTTAIKNHRLIGIGKKEKVNKKGSKNTTVDSSELTVH